MRVLSENEKEKSMALKFKYKSKAEVPGLYVERDGALVLDVEGAVDRAKVEEFRTNNIELANELAEQKRRFDGIDPAEARRLFEFSESRSAAIPAYCFSSSPFADRNRPSTTFSISPACSACFSRFVAQYNMEGNVALLGPAEIMKTEKHEKTFDLCGSAHGLCTYTDEDMKHSPDHQR
jgi:hypothetical protein